MGKRHRRARQPSLWVASTDLPRSAGHPFYQRLNRVLDDAGFDAFVEEQCATFYANGVGRPSLAPGRYFRMLLLGYVEGLDSERAMAWRAADSLSLRQFLDVALHEAPPDHSTVSRTRRRIDVETHLAVFTWVLQRLADATLVMGRTVGIDATTLEANAAMRSIVRRDTRESDDAFLTRLAEASGLSIPTRAELARFDRTRTKKGSNDDWTHPHDPDAKIAKMKDGRTHLAHTAEHAVGHRAQGARVSVAPGAQRLVLAVADRITLDVDARPREDGGAQSVVGRPPLYHEQTLARTPGDRCHPAQTATCIVVPPPHRVAAFSEKRGEHPGTDAGQRQQDGGVGRVCWRRWLVLRRHVRIGRGGSLGELMHQPIELAVRVMKLAVEQREPFNEEPDMRGGGLGRTRCQRDGRRPQPITQRRGIDPTDAVLFQHSGQGHAANPLARARGRQAPPQVERPRRRDVVVNRGEELWIVAPELLPHLIRQAHAFPRQLLAQPRPLP